MAGPITWRTLQGPSATEAVRPLEAASRSFNQGFSGLQDVLDQRLKAQSNEWQAQAKNNTQDFLDQLSQFRTPEELAAAQASGQIDQMRQGYGAQIDRAAVRNADAARLAGLRQEAVAANAFADDKLAREQEPVKQAMLAAIYSGDKAKFSELLSANPDIKGLDKIQKEGVVWDRDSQRFTWEGDDQKRKGEKHGLDMKLGDSRLESEKVGRDRDRTSMAATRLSMAQAQAANAERMQQQALMKRASELAYGHIQQGGTIGDTAGYQNAIKQLSAEFPTHLVMGAADQVSSLFNGNKFSGPVGRDAEAAALAERQRKAQEAFFGENSVAAPGSAQAELDKDEILKSAKEIAQSPKEYEQLRKAISKITREGVSIPGKDGKPIQVSIPKQYIKSMLDETDENVSWDFLQWIPTGTSNRGEELENALKKRLAEDPKMLEDIGKRFSIEAAKIARGEIPSSKEKSKK